MIREGRPAIRKDFLPAAGIFVGMLLLVPFLSVLSVRFTSDDWYLMDEGTVLYTAFRSSLGAPPHIDGPYYYSGGLEVLLGSVFSLFGSTFAVARWTLGVNMGATASIVYLLCTRLSIDRATGAILAVAITAVGYAMNFHVYPAWFATTLLLIAVLLMWQGVQNRNTLTLIATGFCLGAASALKQTAGLYGLFAFTLFTLIVGSHLRPTITTPHGSHRVNLWLAFLAALPSAILMFFVLLLRNQLMLINVVMFLTVPAVMVVYATKSVVDVRRRSPYEAASYVHLSRRVLGSLHFGFLLGFLLLVAYFTLHGGIGKFFSEAFVNVQQAFANRYTVFKFMEDPAANNPLVMLRWFILYIIPVATAVFAFRFTTRQDRSDVRIQLLLLASITIAILFFTLYPIAIRMYVLFLFPFVAIPLAFLADAALKRVIPSSLVRSSLLITAIVLAIGAYVVGRQLAGDLPKITTGNVAVLDQKGGDVYVPQATMDYVGPVLSYLEGRPKTESFVGFDVFNKLIAFITQRKIHADYLQRHYFNEITPEDFAELRRSADENRIDTIVIGKAYLTGSLQEQILFEYLKKNYTLALNNTTHLVFQRISG